MPNLRPRKHSISAPLFRYTPTPNHQPRPKAETGTSNRDPNIDQNRLRFLPRKGAKRGYEIGDLPDRLRRPPDTHGSSDVVDPSAEGFVLQAAVSAFEHKLIMQALEQNPGQQGSRCKDAQGAPDDADGEVEKVRLRPTPNRKRSAASHLDSSNRPST